MTASIIRVTGVVGIILLASISGFAVVTGDSQSSTYEPIKSADDNPKVTERGALRLLTGNDVDQNATATHRSIFNISARNLQLRWAAEGAPIVRIDNTSFTTHQAKQYALLTDGYRETLYTETRIPHNDSWQSGNEVTIQDASFIGFKGNTTTPERSGKDGIVYVEIESEPGQLPARNVEVLQEDGSDNTYGELYIANPDEIEVYDGNMKSYKQTNRDAVSESFLDTGLNKSVVPATGTGSDNARYTVHTAEMEGKWHGNETVIKDHYVGVARITEGALYDSHWIVNPDGINVTTLYDYRVDTPYTPDNKYTETTTCSYSYGENNTKTGYATVTKYEYYENARVANESMKIWHNGSYHYSGEQSQIVPIENPSSGSLSPNSTVTIKYDHTHGFDYPDKCSQTDNETTETKTVTSSIGKSTKHQIEPAEATDLSITAYVKNASTSQEVYVDIVGNQRPEANPLGSVQIKANNGDGVWKVYTPWIFFPQSLYDRVEVRQENASTWKQTSVKTDSGPPNLHRDYMDANSYKDSNYNTIAVSSSGSNVAQTYEGINVGANVSDTQGDVKLYRTWGGMVITTGPGRRITNFTAQATDIFGNKIEVDTEFVAYNRSDIKLKEADNGKTVNGKLVNSTGAGIPNREISIRGGNVSQVSTDSNGEFQVPVEENASTTFIAEFKGDELRDNHPTHYESSKTQIVTTAGTLNVVATPLAYLATFVSNIMVVLHWIVLGVFFTWWAKYRNSK
jgi:hypothetical protein